YENKTEFRGTTRARSPPTSCPSSIGASCGGSSISTSSRRTRAHPACDGRCLPRAGFLSGCVGRPFLARDGRRQGCELFEEFRCSQRGAGVPGKRRGKSDVSRPTSRCPTSHRPSMRELRLGLRHDQLSEGFGSLSFRGGTLSVPPAPP